jgi:DNA-binding NarL/FixJ family response regulator
MRSSCPTKTENAVPLKETPKRVRILIADKSPMHCELLRAAFKRYSNRIEVAACEVASTGIVRSVSQVDLDVALINADLEDGSLMGLETLRGLHLSHPTVRIVILFDSWRDDLILHAFRAGAKGVFCRAEPFDRLCKCILSVHNGQVWANSHQLQLLLQTCISAAPPRVADAQGQSLLIRRESQVVHLISEGLPNREISSKLGITQHTVSNYLFRIFDKLGVSNRLELALYIMKQRHDAELKNRESYPPVM